MLDIIMEETPIPLPDAATTHALMLRCGMTPEIQTHCQAVDRAATALSGGSDVPLDGALLHAACLLHDLCRVHGRTHASEAEMVLADAGYPVLGAVIGQHHDLRPGARAEAEVLYLADKLVQGTSPCSLAERFSRARVKCVTAEAVSAWQQRYDQARRLMDKYSAARVCF